MINYPVLFFVIVFVSFYFAYNAERVKKMNAYKKNNNDFNSLKNTIRTNFSVASIAIIGLFLVLIATVFFSNYFSNFYFVASLESNLITYLGLFFIKSSTIFLVVFGNSVSKKNDFELDKMDLKMILKIEMIFLFCIATFAFGVFLYTKLVVLLLCLLPFIALILLTTKKYYFIKKETNLPRISEA
ncbi:MAG: hypothetical protein V4667_11545 [Bacteroidota bacterium]